MSDHPAEADGAVIVRVERHEPAPVVVSRTNCTVYGILPDDWRRVVRRLGVPYRRVGHDLFVAADALRDALVSGAAPAPMKRRKPTPPATDDHRAVLEAAGFRRRGAA